MRKKLILYIIVASFSAIIVGYVSKVIAQPSSSSETSGLITSRIEIASSSTSQPDRWEAMDGYAGRFPVNLGETLRLSIQLAKLKVGKPVFIQAPHGGVLNEKQSHFVWTPQSVEDRIELTYQVGRARGVYLISLRQGLREEVIEFWAGEEKPLGEAGPQIVEVQ